MVADGTVGRAGQMQGRVRDQSEWAEAERPWELPAFWRSVDEQIAHPETEDLAEFLRPDGLEEAERQALWRRFCEQRLPSRPR